MTPDGCAEVELQRVTIHGHERVYVQMGSGPVLLLLHGLGCDHTTWLPVLRDLARDFTVIAPDLLGHGQSAKPRADYSVGGYANGMRDLLTVLGIDKVTVVGHSFGGGVAMQFAYQFPERTERMILVAPGGMGPEVSPLIRAVTLPGFHQAMGLATLPGVRQVNRLGLKTLAKAPLGATRDLGEVADIVESFKDPRARAAIRHVVKAVVDTRGQIVTMVDRAYLTQAMPMLVVWGTDDLVIPSRHAEHVARIAPGAVVELLRDSGHFPHKDHPERFGKIVRDFVASTRPATYHRGRWRTLLRNGPGQPANRAEAGEAPLAPVAVLPRRRATASAG
ncbi:alpha/beta fold hydrolase [Nocardioides aequoreus]|uniref:alpha/beta fold hydrolase n=1 Tax=Nocardioides aequoreus TaxID=397278 RepID=UPI000ABD4229|nr:alpha/beta fold hydrolase [Nocardioides aequoreus]